MNANNDSGDHDPSSARVVSSPEDSISVGAIDKQISDSLIERVEQDNRSIEAVVRSLIAEAEDALAGNSPYDAEAVFETIHYFLIHDDRIRRPSRADDDTLDASTKIRFEDHRDSRRASGSDSTPREEFETQVQVAKALRYIYSYANKTRYIPVRLEKLDIPGMSFPSRETQTHRTKTSRERRDVDEMEEEITINHEDCEHVLVVALPRKGKDSTITSLCGNLKDEHGYKWFSCLDDGRNETPMTAIPNDEKPIKDNLDDFGQEPKAYDAEVFCTGDLRRSRHSSPATSPVSPSTLPISPQWTLFG